MDDLLTRHTDAGPQMTVAEVTVTFAFADPKVSLSVAHPISACLEKRLGLKTELLPPRNSVGAFVGWTGLVLRDRWDPSDGDWRYVGTVVQSGAGLGMKAEAPVLSTAFVMPADGSSPGIWSENNLDAGGQIVP